MAKDRIDALAIAACDVRVTYGDTVALDGLDFAVAPGLVHGLIGMNGSGKSTLFKALMGLVRVDTGTVRLFGGSPDKARRAGRVAYAPQNEDVDWAFPVSVEEVVTMGRYGLMGWRRRPSDEDRRAVDEALERVELSDLRERQIGELSGGQRKRVVRGPRARPGRRAAVPRRAVRGRRQAQRGDDHRAAARARRRGADDRGLDPRPRRRARAVRPRGADQPAHHRPRRRRARRCGRTCWPRPSAASSRRRRCARRRCRRCSSSSGSRSPRASSSCSARCWSRSSSASPARCCRAG